MTPTSFFSCSQMESIFANFPELSTSQPTYRSWQSAHIEAEVLLRSILQQVRVRKLRSQTFRNILPQNPINELDGNFRRSGLASFRKSVNARFLKRGVQLRVHFRFQEMPQDSQFGRWKGSRETTEDQNQSGESCRALLHGQQIGSERRADPGSLHVSQLREW